MNYKQVILAAAFLGLTIGIVIVIITDMCEQRESNSLSQSPFDPFKPSAPDVSALIEEARKITREADYDS